MTFDEFKVLAKGMKAVYTQTTFLPDADALKVWFQLLQDLDYKAASAAVQKHMVTSRFPPTIAEIRDQAAAIVYRSGGSWADGWEQVQRAIRWYGQYNVKAALESFDPVTRQTVEVMDFTQLCMSENPIADRAHFQRIYESHEKREKEQRMIPEGLRLRIEEVQKVRIAEIESERLPQPD